jgi:hypothetical protein
MVVYALSGLEKYVDYAKKVGCIEEDLEEPSK